MFMMLVTAGLSAANPSEPWAFRAADAVEMALTPQLQKSLVGQIIVVGNENTPQSIILDQLMLHPGQQLCYWRLRAMEVRLALLGLFKVDLQRHFWPCASALDEGSDVRDIKIEVVEKRQGSPAVKP